MDDVILAHKPRQLNMAAQLTKHSPQAALDLAATGVFIARKTPIQSAALSGPMDSLSRAYFSSAAVLAYIIY